MHRTGFTGHQFPGLTQELLLHAALSEEGKALSAWKEWRRTADVGRLDAGSKRLLLLVYRNLGRDSSDEELAGLRPIYLKTWSKNRIQFNVLTAIVNRFREHGVEVLVLKGGALIPIAYRDFGARSMTDIDILVRHEAAARAIDLLRAWNWKPTLDHPEGLIEIRHGDEFVADDGLRLDLHWNVLQESCGPRWNNDFWCAASTWEHRGVQAGALCAADQLLHVIVHGARFSEVQPVAWVADSIVLLRSCGDLVDWDRFERQVRLRRLTVAVRYALSYLAGWEGIGIPGSVLAELQRVKTGWSERLEYRVKVSPRPLIGTLPVLWFDYLRVAKALPRRTRLWGFVTYLRLTFRQPSLTNLVLSIVRLAASRTRAYVALRRHNVPSPVQHHQVLKSRR